MPARYWQPRLINLLIGIVPWKSKVKPCHAGCLHGNYGDSYCGIWVGGGVTKGWRVTA